MQLADIFARVVGRASEDRLQRVMRSPMRRVILNGVFRQMPRQIDPEQAKNMESSIRWCITGNTAGEADVYQLDFNDGRAEVTRAPRGPDPQLTITLEAAEFLRLAAGQTDPTRAYFSGRVALAGDVMLAAKLGGLFRTPSGGKQSAG